MAEEGNNGNWGEGTGDGVGGVVADPGMWDKIDFLRSLLQNPDEVISEALRVAYVEDNEEVWDEAFAIKINFNFSSSNAAFEEYVYSDVRIPCLNIMSPAEMKKMNGKVVRFRCMVQEVYDPVFYQTKVVMRNSKTGEVKEHCLMFDNVLEGEDWEESESNPKDLNELTILHCISIPGENPWVLDLDRSKSRRMESDTPSTSNAPHCALNGQVKKAALSFPLESMVNDKACKAAICKVFFPLRGQRTIKINDVLDIYGKLMIDEKEEDGNSGNNDEACESDENLVRNPPSLIIPRISVYGVSSRCSFKSLLDMDRLANQLAYSCNTVEPALKTLEQATLLDIFEQCFLGDILCARYCLMNLLSAVSCRVGGTPLGSFPISIIGIPAKVCHFLEKVFSALVTKSVYLSSVWDNLSNDKFEPKKDYNLNKLVPGFLQLSNGTHLLVEENETTEQQRLNIRNSEKGLKNLNALQKLIEWQVVEYNFQFQHLEFQHDVPVLILCTSLETAFKNTVQIPFAPTMTLEEWDTNVLPRINALLEDKTKTSMLRDFILHRKEHSDFKIDENYETFISCEYARLRHATEPQDRMDSDDLHRILTMARLSVKYTGDAELSKEVWNDVRCMETTRKLRLLKLQQQ